MKSHARLLLLVAAMSAPLVAQSDDSVSSAHAAPLLYASLGEDILGYRVDAQAATLTYLSDTKAPANVQFAVKNSAGSILYVVSSNAGNGTLGAKGDNHVLTAYRINQETGALDPLGTAVHLPERPINLTLDRDNHFALVAYNQSATLSVHPIAADGSVGPAVEQKQVPQAGIFTHQVTLTPDNKAVIALARGNDPVGKVPEQPGSINTFTLDAEGHLNKVAASPFPVGIGPRHLSYHPTQPWVYVAMERGSKLYMYHLGEDGHLSNKPVFHKETLVNMADIDAPRQRGGVVQVSPNGKFLYTTNRADAVNTVDGKQVSAGGENNVVAFALDAKTGEPRMIQHVDGHGIEGRTMKVDPSGKLLIVANQKSLWVKHGKALDMVRANLSVFRIAKDGKLTFVRKYDMTDEKKSLLWMDI